MGYHNELWSLFYLIFHFTYLFEGNTCRDHVSRYKINHWRMLRKIAIPCRKYVRKKNKIHYYIAVLLGLFGYYLYHEIILCVWFILFDASIMILQLSSDVRVLLPVSVRV